MSHRFRLPTHTTQHLLVPTITGPSKLHLRLCLACGCDENRIFFERDGGMLTYNTWKSNRAPFLSSRLINALLQIFFYVVEQRTKSNGCNLEMPPSSQPGLEPGEVDASSEIGISSLPDKLGFA